MPADVDVSARLDVGEYAHRVRFRFVGPDEAPPRWWLGVDHRSRRVGIPLDLLNTKLPVDARATRRRLMPVLAIPRLSTYPIAALLQHAVRVMPRESMYLNVGVWHGFSLFAGMAGNADRHCVGVDNFSEHYGGGTWGDVRSAFLERFERVRAPRHEFYDMDYREYFRDVQRRPIGVFAYDAGHSYEDQLDALERADAFMAEGSVVVIDDAQSDGVRRAIVDFLAARAGAYAIVFDQAVAVKAHPTWWGGIAVLRKR